MAHAIYEYDYSGDLVDNIFFELIIPLNHLAGLPVDKWPLGTVVNNPECEEGTFVYGEVLFESYRRYSCPTIATHETSCGLSLTNPSDEHLLRYNHYMDLYGGASMSKFVCDTDGMTVVVSAEYKNEILCSNLAGFSMVSLPVPAEVNQSQIRSPRLFFLKYQQTNCFRAHKIIAPTPNECPFCGTGPVVCTSCQHVEWDCPRCKHRLVVPESEHMGTGDRRFTTQGAPAKGWIIEGDKWDGADAIAGVNQAFVTGRFVEFSLRCGATPFVAKPCLVDISRCSSQQTTKLKQAQFNTKQRFL